MLPGLSGMLAGGNIAVPSILSAGQNNFDFDGNGTIDATIIGKNPNVGSFNVQPFTGFTCTNFHDKYDGAGIYIESYIWIEGAGASLEIPSYTFVTIAGSKRSITWTIDNASRVTITTTHGFSFSNGAQYSILFGK